MICSFRWLDYQARSFYCSHTCLPGTISAPEKLAVGLGAMSDDLGAAMIAGCRKAYEWRVRSYKTIYDYACYHFKDK